MDVSTLVIWVFPGDWKRQTTETCCIPMVSAQVSGYVPAHIKFEFKHRYVGGNIPFDTGNDRLQGVAPASDLREDARVSLTPPIPAMVGRAKPGESMDTGDVFAGKQKVPQPVRALDLDTGGATGRSRTMFLKFF